MEIGRANILSDHAATKNRHQLKASGAGVGYSQRKEVGTLSLQLPMGLGVEYLVNFEVNL